jgi:hypothetical protein
MLTITITEGDGLFVEYCRTRDASRSTLEAIENALEGTGLLVNDDGVIFEDHRPPETEARG